MKTYIGTKVIRAMPMDKLTFEVNYKNAPPIDREPLSDDTLEGYLVEYEGGYLSWSPKATFERSYREMTLAEKVLTQPTTTSRELKETHTPQR